MLKLRYPWEDSLKEIKRIQKSIELKSSTLANSRETNSKTIAVLSSEINTLKKRMRGMETQMEEMCGNVAHLISFQNTHSNTLTYVMMCGILSGITAAGFVALMLSSI